jgi:hypothetical protein
MREPRDTWDWVLDEAGQLYVLSAPSHFATAALN